MMRRGLYIGSKEQMRDNEGTAGGGQVKPIVIEFLGGGFILIEDVSRVAIYLSRKDIKKVEYVILDGNMIPGDTISVIKGAASSGRVRYV
jgi:hypothetical protein